MSWSTERWWRCHPLGVHGQITFRAGYLLGQYVEPRHLGVIFAAETGVILGSSPPVVRAPDLAFIASGRLTEAGIPDGYVPIAPDFVVEVVSPHDSASDVQSRIDTWLRAGVKVAWVIYPASQAVLVYRGMDRIERRSGDEELGAESAIPGFRCKAGDLFPGGAS